MPYFSCSSGESAGKYSNLHPVRVWYDKIIPLNIRVSISYLDRIYPAMRGAGMDSQDFLPFLKKGKNPKSLFEGVFSAIIQSASLAFLSRWKRDCHFSVSSGNRESNRSNQSCESCLNIKIAIQANPQIRMRNQNYIPSIGIDLMVWKWLAFLLSTEVVRQYRLFWIVFMSTFRSIVQMTRYCVTTTSPRYQCFFWSRMGI